MLNCWQDQFSTLKDDPYGHFSTGSNFNVTPIGSHFNGSTFNITPVVRSWLNEIGIFSIYINFIDLNFTRLMPNTSNKMCSFFFIVYTTNIENVKKVQEILDQPSYCLRGSDICLKVLI